MFLVGISALDNGGNISHVSSSSTMNPDRELAELDGRSAVNTGSAIEETVLNGSKLSLNHSVVAPNVGTSDRHSAASETPASWSASWSTNRSAVCSGRPQTGV